MVLQSRCQPQPGGFTCVGLCAPGELWHRGPWIRVVGL